LISYIDTEVDEAFINRQSKTKFNAKSLKNIQYCPSHDGTSITIIPETFKRAGYTNFQVVAEQKAVQTEISYCKIT
jgi:hypothetical protein